MKTQGFSLLELSIVLVIIGLLASGVMVGQSLVRGAELRSVMTDYSKILTSFNAFRGKYNAVPGDMKNATSYWGTAATCPPTLAAPLTTAATCNGTGNGLLLYGEISAVQPEIFLVWHHLINAGMFEGNLTGASGSATVAYVRPGINVPESRISGVGYNVVSWGNNLTNDPVLWAGGGSSVSVLIGSDNPAGYNTFPAFSAPDAYSIDVKMDNGKPGSGIFRSLKQTDCVVGVTATTSQTAAIYDLTKTTVACSLIASLGGDPGTSN
ncbi:MAG: type II secretion system GspH family protein [Rickettsiales bacterium]|nr:type II secretion system GspH family protein [Rickettsiales bacterium]